MEYAFKKLDIWQKGMIFVEGVYKISDNFPDKEKFALSSQLRRAAISVPLNIAEGSARRSKKEFASFLRIALGSLVEALTCLEISERLGYVSGEDNDKIKKIVEEIYFKILRLEKVLKSS